MDIGSGDRIDASQRAIPPHSARATRAAFLVCGFAVSCWAAIIPDAKLRLGADEQGLGLALLAFGGGGLISMPIAAAAIARFGSRPVIAVAGAGIAITLPLLSWAPSLLAVGAILLLFGGFIGALDVGMNEQAVVIEGVSDRPMMSSFHALYSLGGLAGAAAMSACLGAGLSAMTSAILGGGFAGLLALSQSRHLVAPARDMTGTCTRLPRPDLLVLALGLMAFVSFMIEGAVLDWSGILLRFVRGSDAAWAALGYAMFSIAMGLGRLSGDRLVARFGPGMVLGVGAVFAGAAMVGAAAIPSDAADLICFGCVGLGAANIVPIVFSAGGGSRRLSAGTAIAVITAIGYAGLLVGPPIIGFAAAAISLPLALTGAGVAIAALALGVRLVGRGRPR